MSADYEKLQVRMLEVTEGLEADEARHLVREAQQRYPEDYRERAELLKLYGCEIISRVCQDADLEEANKVWQEWIQADPIELNEACLEWWTGVAAMLPTSIERADQLLAPPSS